MDEQATKQPDKVYESKRIGAALCCIISAGLVAAPQGPVTPYIPMLQVMLSAAAAILCGVSKWQEGKP